VTNGIYYTSIPFWYFGIPKEVSTLISKKQQVIEAARELFENYGYKKVSMNEIAKKSNVTKKTIYTYFKDKDELLKYFVYEELKVMEEISDNISKKNISYSEKIHELIFALLDYKQNSKLFNSLAQEAKDISSETAKECATIINDSIMTQIKNKLDKAISEGYIKKCNTDLIAFIIFKIYIAVLFEWDFDKNNINNKELAITLTSIIENGLLK
jgi:AcrR family transcriptional regulator